MSDYVPAEKIRCAASKVHALSSTITYAGLGGMPILSRLITYLAIAIRLSGPTCFRHIFSAFTLTGVPCTATIDVVIPHLFPSETLLSPSATAGRLTYLLFKSSFPSYAAATRSRSSL
jgi:hypothetical protein